MPQQIASSLGGFYQAVVHKYYIDELYATLFVKPLIAGSALILWHGIDQDVIDATLDNSAHGAQRSFRLHSPHAVGQFALLRRMGGGRSGSGDRLHGLDGHAMNMDNWSPIILSLVTFIPLAGALLLTLLPRRDRDIRVFSLVISLLTFVLSLHLPVHLHRAHAGFQFEVDRPWIPTPNIHYHLGVDGISMWLVVLTTFLTPLCVLISWKSIHERVKEFFILLLVLETAMIGVFVALDLFLFYFFWEATLIPMALLIGMYGHGRKVYAAVKFFMYTMIASVFMLAAILWLYAKVGTFDFVTIQNAIRSGQVANFAGAAQWLFLGFFIAFAVKVPLFPFHTWLA